MQHTQYVESFVLTSSQNFQTGSLKKLFFNRDTGAYTVVHYSLVIFAYFGFLFFDLLYIAVTINYCSQCQLLTFYIDNIQDKVRNKKYDNLNLAMKVQYV